MEEAVEGQIPKTYLVALQFSENLPSVTILSPYMILHPGDGEKEAEVSLLFISSMLEA